ncbi:hypothetical protein T459_17757 [Capsicum annuum]|uniref:F-box associated beta-propeller type 3 domain-containing protein n=1 Tax=Capsicum annuum TaxID=4072 RepID=A0A2G2ZCV6_CAPAN|nr:hypothetical protein T459_17757 [Capsicum annuum]
MRLLKACWNTNLNRAQVVLLNQQKVLPKCHEFHEIIESMLKPCMKPRTQQPSKKMKMSVIRRKINSTEKEQEEEKGTYDYFNKLPDDVMTSLFLRCPLKTLSMLRVLSMDVKWCPLSDLLFAQIKYEVLTITKVGGGISFSKWKEIVDTPFSHPLMPGLLVNECMYWLTKRFQRPQPPRDIISFDLENEKFLTISYPSFFESIHGLNLMDLKGMLCLPDEGSFRRSSILDLWILKDKISCTRVKEYSIDLVNFGPGMIKSNFKTWNEEIIFTHLDTVVIYDLKRKCFRVVKRVALARYEIFSTQKACFL